MGDAVDTIQSKSALFGPWGKSDAPYVAFLLAWHNAAQPFALRPWGLQSFLFLNEFRTISEKNSLISSSPNLSAQHTSMFTDCMFLG